MTLIVGIGNEIKRDDVVGLEVTDRIAEAYDLDAEIRTMTSGRLMLIDELSGHDRAILIDAVATEDGTPGEWYQFDPATVEPDSGGGVATHNVGLETLTTLGEAMGESMPEVTIYAIEVADPFTYEEGMTDPVAARVDDLVSEIGDAISEELAAAM
ncbi:hydrogenase maturation protease [Halococcoides cellulosivorans]|uniref:Hydrogenase maturation protease n=1 Tax=Halococcoides cellulosivorans TaxID=1679096 RepID=A0A2R4WY43_9EURY|nr:hydrogenase maturation protease [Halococcoides cellulosivorans]AWB26440.1 hydrogenase maturation protease [Halococcoides cellulosivorans]